MENTILRQIGVYCSDTQYGNIPANVIDKAKRLILDGIGCAFGAFPLQKTALTALTVARSAAHDLRGPSLESTVFVSGEKTSMDMAALVNSTMMRYLDFNDVFKGRAWIIHPSDNISTALAVGEKQRVSGRELLTAIVLGYEIQQRFANLPVSESLWYRGWDPNTTFTYSTAVVAAKLVGLDADGIANAMALAGSRSSLVQIRRGQIAMDKALSIGQLGAASVLAAVLAKHGGTGCSTLIEGDYGLNKVILGNCDLSSLVDGYDEYLMLWAGIKPYPVEFMTVGMIDAALALQAQHGIKAEEITQIRVGVFRDAMAKPSWDPEKLAPKTREAADHSFSWNIAKTLIDGEMTIRQALLNPREDSRIPKLTAKISFVVDDELSKLFLQDPGLIPIWMEITTNSGCFTHRVMAPKGHRENPLSDNQVIAKLRASASWALSDSEIDRLVDTTLALDGVSDVKSEYVPLLIASK